MRGQIGQEKLRETKQAAGEYVTKGREKAGAYEETLIAYVRDNPMKSVLIAVGVGAALGVLLSRR